jgi:hypothetical protein
MLLKCTILKNKETILRQNLNMIRRKVNLYSDNNKTGLLISLCYNILCIIIITFMSRLELRLRGMKEHDNLPRHEGDVS